MRGRESAHGARPNKRRSFFPYSPLRGDCNVQSIPRIPTLTATYLFLARQKKKHRDHGRIFCCCFYCSASVTLLPSARLCCCIRLPHVPGVPRTRTFFFPFSFKGISSSSGLRRTPCVFLPRCHRFLPDTATVKHVYFKSCSGMT